MVVLTSAYTRRNPFIPRGERRLSRRYGILDRPEEVPIMVALSDNTDTAGAELVRVRVSVRDRVEVPFRITIGLGLELELELGLGLGLT